MAGVNEGDLVTAIATDAAGNTSEFSVNFAVGAPAYSLLLSLSSNRSSPLPLASQVVSGNIYVFTSPDADVIRVRFFLDDPGQTGGPFRTENTAPYDFAGGSVATEAGVVDGLA